MNKNIVTVATALRLIPCERVIRFFQKGVCGIMQYTGKINIPINIPGTLMISATQTGGIIKKEVTWEEQQPSAELLNNLELYKTQKYVALYKDQWGFMRLCGNMEHPLTFQYSMTGETLKITLNGEDTRPDLYATVLKN